MRHEIPEVSTSGVVEGTGTAPNGKAVLPIAEPAKLFV